MKGYFLVFVFACLKVSTTEEMMAYQLITFQGISFQECSKECLNRPGCKSLTYIRGAANCQLFNNTLYLPNSTESSRGQKRYPGYVYRDAVDLQKLQFSSNTVTTEAACHGTSCKSGEECDSNIKACKVSECPFPKSIPGAQRYGNLYEFGSKIKFNCLNVYTAALYSECQTNGTWSAVHMTCETQGFQLYATGKYMNNGFRLPDSFELQPIYLEECLKECNESTEFCIGVNYNTESMTCVSTNTLPFFNDHAEPDDLKGWILYEKILPVYALREIIADRLFVSYGEAREFCASAKTSLPSYNDVLMAYNLGFSMCACIWVDEEYAVTSLHFQHEKCGDIGVRRCNPMANAIFLCKNPRFVFSDKYPGWNE